MESDFTTDCMTGLLYHFIFATLKKSIVYWVLMQTVYVGESPESRKGLVKNGKFDIDKHNDGNNTKHPCIYVKIMNCKV